MTEAIMPGPALFGESRSAVSLFSLFAVDKDASIHVAPTRPGFGVV